MTPGEHQQAAERLLDQVEGDGTSGERKAMLVARAHVHAVLASRAPWTSQERETSFQMDPARSEVIPLTVSDVSPLD